MKIVVAVDWSDQDLTGLNQALQIYRPTEVTLVHAIDISLYFEQGAAVEHETERGAQLLDRAAAMVPADVKTVRKINESGNPAQLILDCAYNTAANLVVVGTRGRGRLAEAFLGSVSDRVVLHATRSTMVVKGEARKVHRVLVAVEGPEDADRIAQWLTKHPFKDATELCIFNAVVPIELRKTTGDETGTRALLEGAERRAAELVKTTASKLSGSPYTVSTKVAIGKPAVMIQEQAKDKDLVVLSSHGRKGLSRFLMGSVSHSVVHDVACPVIVVR
jgi:nucleotide-binding universal stress UspA family protein